METKAEEELQYRSIPIKEQMATLKRILKFIKPHIKQFAIAVLLVVFLAIVNAIQPRIIQTFRSDYLAAGVDTRSTAMMFGAIYFGLTLVKAIVTFFELYLFNMASERTVENVRNQLFAKVHSLGMRFFDNTSTGWIVTRVTNDTEALKDYWKVSLLILAFVPILVIVTRFYQSYSSKTYSEMKSKNSMLTTQLAVSINGMSIIQQFRQENRMVKEFEEINDSHFQSSFSMKI